MNISLQPAYHNPLGRDDYISIQHIERYRFACKLLHPDQTILDIACGYGYGTFLMSNHGCKVIGADIDADAVAQAKNIWRNCEFIHADALNLPFEDATFDAVVTFETIEHVEDEERFLSEMKRVLKPGGLFICSTPNIRYTAHPPYHLKEYTPDEFFKLIKAFFIDVERYAQYFTRMDRIKDLFHWYVRPRLNFMVRFIEILHLKPTIKRLLRYENKITTEHIANKVLILNESKYKVVPMKGSKLLRIMIAVGRKK
jgi:ubiquinone/menaquinone biosynthesis C-methylase UbiE